MHFSIDDLWKGHFYSEIVIYTKLKLKNLNLVQSV